MDPPEPPHHRQLHIALRMSRILSPAEGCRYSFILSKKIVGKKEKLNHAGGSSLLLLAHTSGWLTPAVVSCLSPAAAARARDM